MMKMVYKSMHWRCWVALTLGWMAVLGGVVGQESLGPEADRNWRELSEEPDRSRVLRSNSFGAIFHPRDELFSIGGGEVHLTSDESTRQAVVITGSIHVEGEIERDLVVVAGRAHVDGRVGGSVIVVGGSATFGPRAEVDGDTVLIGGPFEINPGALIHGDQTEFKLGWLLPAVRSLGTLLGSTVLLARPFAPHLIWTWWLVGGLFIVNLMILLLLPRPTWRCVEALRQGPVTAFLVGMAVLLLFAPLLVLLIASGFGILLIPFLLCVALAMILLGKVAVYSTAGGQVTGSLGMTRDIPILAFTIGSFGFLIAYMIPVIGFMAIGLVIPLGVGAVILAACHAFRREVAPPVGGDGGGMSEGDIGQVGGAEATVPDGSSPSSSSSAGVAGALGGQSETKQSMKDLGGEGERVGFWPRMAATLLDATLIGLLFAMIVGDQGPGTMRLLIFVWLTYHIVMWALKGTTVGGYVLGLRCVGVDGEPLSWATSAIRALGSVLSSAALMIGFFWASWGRDRQSWHDIIAGTTIVRVAKAGWRRPEARSTVGTEGVASTTPSFSDGETKTAS